MLKRGFKAEAERRAIALRRELGAQAHDPVDPEQLAKHLGVEYRSAGDLVPMSALEELEQLQPFAFSACTFRLDGGRTVVILNPLHSEARQVSDGMHELSHLLLRHEMRRLERVGGLAFLTCDPDQEEEANVLGATLLLPRPLLLRAHAAGMSASAIAAQFKVSEQLARWRLNASGVAVQVRRRAS